MAFTSFVTDEISYTDPDKDGVVYFTSPAGEVRLQFTWEALDRLQKQWPGEEYLKRASAGMDEMIVADLAVIISVASGLGEREVRKMGLPLIPVSNACKLAWSYAWNGGQTAQEAKEKPGKRQARLSLFGWRPKMPFGRG